MYWDEDVWRIKNEVRRYRREQAADTAKVINNGALPHNENEKEK